MSADFFQRGNASKFLNPPKPKALGEGTLFYNLSIVQKVPPRMCNIDDFC